MMQIDQRILLVSPPSKNATRLFHVFEFLGEDIVNVELNELTSKMNNTSYRAVIMSVDTSDVSEALDFAEQYPLQPILVFGAGASMTSGNILGKIEFPFTYPQLTELLHYCQVFGRAKHLDTPVESNQTKLFRSLVGSSRGIAKVRHLIHQVANSSASVLILGESGTGKEVVARNIHYLSDRRKGPFIPVNCGAIPPELLESELFGHEKGAFTGAICARKGRFELAEGGTLFLDEIGDMPLQMQVKLLRVLQERVFEKVGGTKTLKANVRVVAATHRDLDKMIDDNDFRQDLFYRLNVFPIEMPSLSQRKEDIPLLLQELISRVFNEGKSKIRFTQRALDSLKEHLWTGNVRELSNLIERLSILYPGGLIDVNDLPKKYRHIDVPIYEVAVELAPQITEQEMITELFSDEAPTENTAFLPNQLPTNGINLKDLLAEIETDMIRQALRLQDNVVARAADTLGMRRTTLVEKMRKYGMSKE